MTVRRFILVRHGESETNHREVHQAGDQTTGDPLTAAGEAMAAALGDRFAGVPLDGVLSSNYRRAMQTAAAIVATTGAPHTVPLVRQDQVVDVSAGDGGAVRGGRGLLREIDVPSALAGLHFTDQRAVAIREQARRRDMSDGQALSDEETLHDLWRRAELIRGYLESRPERLMAVVAHGGILKVLLGHIMFAAFNDVSEVSHQLAAYRAFSQSTWWDNTGAVCLQHDGSGWRWLMTDIAHRRPAYFTYLEDIQGSDARTDHPEGEGNYLG